MSESDMFKIFKDQKYIILFDKYSSNPNEILKNKKLLACIKG